MSYAARTLRDFLREDYCARCDTFGDLEGRETDKADWCNVCWDVIKPLPSTLRIVIKQMLGIKGK